VTLAWAGELRAILRTPSKFTFDHEDLPGVADSGSRIEDGQQVVAKPDCRGGE